MFVLGLLLLVHGFGRLVKTVTAFTVAPQCHAHPGGAGVRARAAPPRGGGHRAEHRVRGHRNRSTHGTAAARPTLAQRQPWLVAFSFGLLHGLAFAGGLSEAGLPAGHIPLALLLFSVGVELGHFAFISLVIALMWLGRWVVGRLSPTALSSRPAALFRLVPAYAIGGMAMFWLIERLAAF